MKESKKFDIYINYKNGNGADKKAIKAMSKLELLDFIEFCARYESRHLIINRMRSVLENY